MSLATPDILHVFEAGEKRAEVQFIDGTKGILRYRVVYMIGKNEGRTSDYFANESYAIEVARGWAYHE
jgi:hypothetical protein